MTKRLDKDREDWCRYLAEGGGGDFTPEHCDLAAELLAEIDALRAERDRLRNALKAIEEVVLDYTRAIGQIPAGGPILAIVETALKEDPTSGAIACAATRPSDSTR